MTKGSKKLEMSSILPIMMLKISTLSSDQGSLPRHQHRRLLAEYHFSAIRVFLWS